ncbi:unnamed protein product [Allacma fusca]|uniref:Uncharacterized protein n=1 Tax=Allacma fusca TaxID=39272 RepID=A0A8J2P5R7_9HEXA|nr:unnamed protein product [Allacma fusca]
MVITAPVPFLYSGIFLVSAMYLLNSSRRYSLLVIFPEGTTDTPLAYTLISLLDIFLLFHPMMTCYFTTVFQLLVFMRVDGLLEEHNQSLSTLGLFGAFSSIVLLNKSNNLPDALKHLMIICLLAVLGNFMQNKMRIIREDFEIELTRHQQTGTSEVERNPVLKWVLNWSWKLTAFDVFDVNHGIFPGIFATILTYLVFVFQLMQSEKSP